MGLADGKLFEMNRCSNRDIIGIFINISWLGHIDFISKMSVFNNPNN